LKEKEEGRKKIKKERRPLANDLNGFDVKPKG